MTISNMADARAWAFDQVMRRPSPLLGLSQDGGFQPYGQAVLQSSVPSLRDLMADAEALALWVYGHGLPDQSTS